MADQGSGKAELHKTNKKKTSRLHSLRRFTTSTSLTYPVQHFVIVFCKSY